MIKKLLQLFNKQDENEVENSSKNTAKDRLTLILAHERTSNIEFIEELKSDILDVIKKYKKEAEDVSFKTSNDRDISALEIEIKI